MSLEELAPDEVVALRFDSPAAAADLAAWCDGRVEADAEQPIVWVPTSSGPRAAELGSWIVQDRAGGHHVMSHVHFSARHAPSA